MGGKSPRWESELWSYLSATDGMRCPFYASCHIRQSGKWCADDNWVRLSRLLDYEQFSLSDYDFIECGTCGGIIRMVGMLAQGLLRKGRVYHPPVPSELVLLADGGHPIEVRLLSLKVHHGATWCLKDGTVIQIKNDDPVATQRFTVFHEAFHILARRGGTPVFRKKGARRAPFNEMLADHFAGCILMPGAWLKDKWAEVKDLDQLAEIFGVPKQAMCIRLKSLGLI